jgi:hypothetical protein
MRGFFDALGRLVFPVAALFGVFVLAYLGSTRFVTQFDVFPPEQWFLNPGYWLTYGHLALPLTFLSLNLVNRKFGPGTTIASVLVTWCIAAGVLIWAVMTYGLGTVEGQVASIGVAATFFGALFAGQLVCIYTFDQVRGIPWWRAPFYGALFGGLIFSGFFYGQMAYGSEEPWANRMAVMAGIYAGAAFVNVFIYWVLRRFIRPMPGFGGA